MVVTLLNVNAAAHGIKNRNKFIRPKWCIVSKSALSLPHSTFLIEQLLQNAKFTERKIVLKP